MSITNHTDRANAYTHYVEPLLVTLDYTTCRPSSLGDAEIAQQVAAERALRQAAELAVAERDSMLAIAAHELRAPLTVLMCQAQLLQRRLDARECADPGDQRAANNMVNQSIRLAQLISALLDVAAIDQGQLRISTTTIDLGALVRRMVQTLQPTLASHTLRLIDDAVPLWVQGDIMRLEQVLGNLLQNAAKYSPAGSEVVIASSLYEGQVRISVCDHGSGIAASARHSLFERFARARHSYDSNTPGLGLGLYICKTIMDLHGGSIEVESAVGAGSTFSLIFPRVEPLRNRNDS